MTHRAVACGEVDRTLLTVGAPGSCSARLAHFDQLRRAGQELLVHRGL
jgi:hypothetical protein